MKILEKMFPFEIRVLPLQENFQQFSKNLRFMRSSCGHMWTFWSRLEILEMSLEIQKVKVIAHSPPLSR